MSPGEPVVERWVERLRALLEEARAAGAFDALRPALAEALASEPPSTSTATGAEPPAQLESAQLAPASRGPIPIRFGMVGDSAPMRALYALLEKVAPSEVSVLIHGETGTGKELVAKALHEFGPRKGKPFLAENCAAVPADLLESELFGHKRGSFTGAVADRAGHFVAADKGTVFLDEVGDMPLSMQPKLLRVLQEGEVRPVGASKVVKVDVRIVAATNKDLRAMVKAGTFREDLYFRLNVVTIVLPPLRERAGDVRHLVRFFGERLGAEMGREVVLTEAALKVLEAWRWPGNVRELENEMRRAVALTSGRIDADDLSPHLRAAR